MYTFSPLEYHTQLASQITPSLHWDGTVPMAEWREKCHRKLWELLGMDTFHICDPVFQITAEDELAGNRHIHFTLQTEEGYHTHCDLLLPHTQNGKLPLCVCLQGHTKGAHISLGKIKYPGDENNINCRDGDYAIRAVQEGFAALAIEQRGFGLCGGTEQGHACERPVMTALLLGRTLISERVWDVMRVLDAAVLHFSDLITLDESVLMGHSGGGTTTYYTACLENRFTGFMPSGSLCNYRDHLTYIHNCTCNYIPGIANYFEMGDLAILIAPKKLTVVCAEEDIYFAAEGVKAAYETIKSLYRAAGAEDACELVLGNQGHRFYADAAWPVMHRLLQQ